MDVQALLQILMNQFQRRIADRGLTSAALDADKDETNRLLAGIPDHPDERLR